MRRSRYPVLRTIVVRPLGNVILSVDATVAVVSGRGMVELRPEGADGIDLRPVEAERLGRALLRAASVARAKDAWAAYHG